MDLRGRVCLTVLTGALAAAVAAGCVRRRTEIVAQIETDMAQGPGATLTAIRVTVTSEGATEPRFDQRYELGVGDQPVVLPADLGIVPRERTDRTVTIEVHALGSNETPLFTRRAVAAF